MKEMKFALGYTPHRLWGNILQAQYVEKVSGKEFFTPKEYIHYDESSTVFQRLTPMQQEVVRLIDSYNDRSIHRLFAKKGTIKEFQDKVSPEMIRDHVRPFIEKYLYPALEIARDNRFPVYIVDKSNRNFFPEDFLTLDEKLVATQFYFSSPCNLRICN